MPEKKPVGDYGSFDFPFMDLLDNPSIGDDIPIYEPSGHSLESTLSGNFEDRMKILQVAIEEIDSEIDVRMDLSKGLNQNLKNQRDWIAGNLRQFEDWKFGYKPSIDIRRTGLEKELCDIYREVRSERQKVFLDVLSLKRERRALKMEHESLKATGKALSP